MLRCSNVSREASGPERARARSRCVSRMATPTYSATSLLGRKLVQVALTSRDLERSKAFYRDVLGLPFLFEVSNMVFFQMGDMRLMIGKEASLVPGGSVLYIDAPDIDTLGPELEKRGVKFGGGVS